MNFLNSTQCERMIINCLEHNSLWTPEETDDCVSYEHTEISDRDDDAPLAHCFEFTTTRKLSEREFLEFYETAVEAFGVRRGYEETAGKACTDLYISDAREKVSYMDDGVVLYFIRVSFYYDV